MNNIRYQLGNIARKLDSFHGVRSARHRFGSVLVVATTTIIASFLLLPWMLRHFIIAYLLAAMFSSNVFLNPTNTIWGNAWTWFWLVFWFLFTGSPRRTKLRNSR